MSELTFWMILLAVMATFLFVVCPLVNRYLNNKDLDNALPERKFEVYHDDTEDWV